MYNYYYAHLKLPDKDRAEMILGLFFHRRSYLFLLITNGGSKVCILSLMNQSIKMLSKDLKIDMPANKRRIITLSAGLV